MMSQLEVRGWIKVWSYVNLTCGNLRESEALRAASRRAPITTSALTAQATTPDESKCGAAWEKMSDDDRHEEDAKRWRLWWCKSGDVSIPQRDLQTYRWLQPEQEAIDPMIWSIWIGIESHNFRLLNQSRMILVSANSDDGDDEDDAGADGCECYGGCNERICGDPFLSVEDPDPLNDGDVVISTDSKTWCHQQRRERKEVIRGCISRSALISDDAYDEEIEKKLVIQVLKKFIQKPVRRYPLLYPEHHLHPHPHHSIPLDASLSYTHVASSSSKTSTSASTWASASSSPHYFFYPEAWWWWSQKSSTRDRDVQVYTLWPTLRDAEGRWYHNQNDDLIFCFWLTMETREMWTLKRRKVITTILFLTFSAFLIILMKRPVLKSSKWLPSIISIIHLIITLSRKLQVITIMSPDEV